MFDGLCCHIFLKPLLKELNFPIITQTLTLKLAFFYLA